jgi:hypothetical protein
VPTAGTPTTSDPYLLETFNRREVPWESIDLFWTTRKLDISHLMLIAMNPFEKREAPSTCGRRWPQPIRREILKNAQRAELSAT